MKVHTGIFCLYFLGAILLGLNVRFELHNRVFQFTRCTCTSTSYFHFIQASSSADENYRELLNVVNGVVTRLDEVTMRMDEIASRMARLEEDSNTPVTYNETTVCKINSGYYRTRSCKPPSWCKPPRCLWAEFPLSNPLSKIKEYTHV